MSLVGDDLTDVRKVPPKMFATSDSRCPVEAYKFYASKRPEGMRDPDSTFYVATRTVPLRDPENDKWFINQHVGQKKLSKMMKQMQITGELNPAKRLTNHSARKHLVQKLRDSDVAPTDIMQISGHKNIQSVLTYSKMNEKQHRVCSDILSKSSTKSATLTKNEEKESVLIKSEFPQLQSVSNLSNVESVPCVSYPTPSLPNSVARQDAISGVPQHLQSLFTGATLHLCNLNLYLNGNK